MVKITEFQDWKDTEGIIDSIKDGLKEFGIRLEYNPSVEGQDGYSFIIMKEEYDEEELYDAIKEETMIDLGYEEEDMDDDSIEDEVNRETDKRIEMIKSGNY